MSLVHDALQKAEREKLRKTGAQPLSTPKPAQPFSPARPRPVESTVTTSVTGVSRAVASPTLSPEVPPQKKQSGLLPMLIGIVAIVALVAIVFLAMLATSTFRDSRTSVQSTPSASPTPTPSVAVPKPQEQSTAPVVTTEPAPAPPQPLSTAATESGFHLTGIMPNPDGKYMAILNGHVVSESSFVDGATIKSIEHNQVMLDVNGKQLVLQMQ
jgi:hypothetical protein